MLYRQNTGINFSFLFQGPHPLSISNKSIVNRSLFSSLRVAARLYTFFLHIPSCWAKIWMPIKIMFPEVGEQLCWGCVILLAPVVLHWMMQALAQIKNYKSNLNWKCPVLYTIFTVYIDIKWLTSVCDKRVKRSRSVLLVLQPGK